MILAPGLVVASFPISSQSHVDSPVEVFYSSHHLMLFYLSTILLLE